MPDAGDSAAGFSLHPRLAADTAMVCRLPLCEVLRMNDRQYPWLVLVPRRAGIREIHQLDRDDQLLLWQEATAVSAALEADTAAHKMNLAALGNMVPQLHVHIIARFEGDPAWPAPVWGARPPLPFPPEEIVSECSRLASALADL